MEFLTTTISALRISPDARLLVVCGGAYDSAALRAAGFREVTISNVDTRQTSSGFAWAYQDAESLTYPDASFDWVIVNGGLHHCASPHRALLEMYRVCRVGVLVSEARDSLLMRAAVRLGIVPQFELEAVVLEGGETGGVRNSAVPNFIYRWTEREIRKTIESAHPQSVHDFRFFYGLSFPTARLAMSAFRFIVGPLNAVAWVIQRLMPRQGNLFGIAILKTGEFKPWIDVSGTRMNRNYALNFDPAKYRR
jgi:SAM-dependent methyltransferase